MLEKIVVAHPYRTKFEGNGVNGESKIMFINLTTTIPHLPKINMKLGKAILNGPP